MRGPGGGGRREGEQQKIVRKQIIIGGCGGSPPMKMFKSMLVASGACMIADDIKQMLQRCIQNPKWFKQLALYMVLKFPGWWKSTTFFCFVSRYKIHQHSCSEEYII